MRIQPKNWTDFQHYNKRTPPWIKLHRNILDNYEFHMLPVASKALAPCLWLLASEYKDGIIDAPLAKISFRMRMTEEALIEAITPLITHDFFISYDNASDTIATRNQGATLETEVEIEKETDKRETQTFEADVLRLKSLHLSTCGLISSPPLQIFRDILSSGKPVTVIEDVYSFCGGDPQPYRQRNIVERLTGIRDGNAMFAVEEWGKAMSAEEMVAKGLIG